MFQYRNKTASMKAAYAESLPLRELARELGVVLLVNDRCDLAMAIDADGVHLGQNDLPYVDARRLLGSHKLIGLSTHNAEQVHAAGALHPDYIGFGPIFTPGSKADHDPLVGVEGLKRIRPLIRLPVFAIGGIQLCNVETVIQAGADGVAVVSAVLGAADVTMAVREFIARMPRPAS